MNKIKENDCVVLTADLPGEDLEAGDAGTVATIETSDLRPISKRDTSHVRQLQAA